MRLGMGLGLGNLLSGGPITGLSNKYSFNFDSSSDYLLSQSNINITGSSAFSMGCWFKPTSASLTGFIAIIAFSDVEQHEESTLCINSGKLGWNNQHGDGDTYDNTTSLSADTWYHGLATFNGSDTVKLYLNGSLIFTKDDVSNVALTADPLYIGKRETGNNFTGLIDEVAIWNTTLSASDIAKHASKPLNLSKASSYDTDRTSSLKLWLRAGDKVLPESDASIARSDFYTDFDGTNDYVVNDSFTGHQSTTGTLSCWAKLGDTTGWQHFVGLGGTTTTGATRALAVNGASLNFVGYSENWDTTVDLSASVWNHLVVTWSGTSIVVYVNGIGYSQTLSNLVTPTGTKIVIGGQAWDNGALINATISNISVYKTQLDAQTIKQFAKSRFTPMRDNRFSVVDFDGADDYINASTVLDGTYTITAWVQLTSTGGNRYIADFRTSSGTGYWYFDTASPSASSSSSGTPYVNGTTTATITAGGWNHIALSGITIDSSSVKIGMMNDGSSYEWLGSMSSVSIYSGTKSADEVYALYSKGITYDESSLSGLVGYWRMGDDTSKAYPTVADSSSNSNDGTITNGASDDIVQQMVAGYDMGAFESTGEELNPSLATSLTWNNNSYETFITSGNSITEAGNTSGHGICYSSAFSVTAGKVYKFTFNFTLNSGSFSGGVVRVGTATSMSSSNDTLVTSPSNGLQSYYYTPSSSSSSFLIGLRLDSGSFNFSFTDLSIQEVLQSADLSDTYPAIIDVNEPVLGVEAITNGTFDSDSSWTKGTGWTIGSGVATSDSSAQSATSYLKSTSFTALDASTTYKLSFRRVQTNTGSLVMLGLGGSDTTIVTYSTTTTGTDEVVYFKPSGANTSLWVTSGDGNFSGSVDNISIKEVFGNVGTMTNQDSADLVYSSVLPDQSFLTGVNSAYNFIDLDGSDEYIKNESFTGHQTTTGTISCWIKFGDISGYQYFIGAGGNTNTGTNRALGLLNENLRFLGYSADEDTGADVSADTWYHIVLTWSGTSVVVYVDGTAHSWTESGLVTPTGTKFSVGVFPTDYGTATNASVGTTAVWNKTLSSDEVDAIKLLGRHGNLLDKYSDNLVLYWAMGALDASTGLKDVGNGTIYDRSGNSVHGTAINTEATDLASSPNADPNGYAKGDTNRSTTIP